MLLGRVLVLHSRCPKKVANRILGALLGNQPFAAERSKVVQRGPNWSKQSKITGCCVVLSNRDTLYDHNMHIHHYCLRQMLLLFLPYGLAHLHHTPTNYLTRCFNQLLG